MDHIFQSFQAFVNNDKYFYEPDDAFWNLMKWQAF